MASRASTDRPEARFPDSAQLSQALRSFSVTTYTSFYPLWSSAKLLLDQTTRVGGASLSAVAASSIVRPSTGPGPQDNAPSGVRGLC